MSCYAPHWPKSLAEWGSLVDNHPILRYNSKQLWRHYKITETNDYEN